MEPAWEPKLSVCLLLVRLLAVSAAPTTTIAPTAPPSTGVPPTIVPPTTDASTPAAGGVGLANSWVEVLSLLLLGALTFLGYRLQATLTRIEQQRRDEEIRTQKRANVTASFESRPSANPKHPPEHFLVLRNLGPAAARDVWFEIMALGDDRPPTLIGDGRASDFANARTIPLLDPEARYPIRVQVLAATARIVNVALRWTDEEGPKEKTLQLSLF
jgi:hypothetical protein